MRRLGVAARSRPPLPAPGEDVRVRSRGGVPVRLEWHERVLPVLSVEASWCVDGRWWLNPNCDGIRRRYFRLCVQVPGGHQMSLELFRTKQKDAPAGEWRVWRVAD